MKLSKKVVSGLLAGMLLVGALSGCGSEKKEATGAVTGKISVISREDGSGTRGAFIELFGIEKKDDKGKKIDHTSDNALITNSTAVMMTTVAGNKAAIGYISLGSLNDTVKALKIDGAEASAANIKSGTYKIARPFNIVTKATIKPEAADFIKFIMSKEGQAVVSKNGYIGSADAKDYAAAKLSGKIVVAGSSSVTPVMEKLKEAYAKVNPDVKIEVQQSDSTTGVKAAISGICDIGMASRELKASEKEAGLQNTVIAIDGIAVVVNKANTINDLTKAQVADVFMGKATEWNKL